MGEQIKNSLFSAFNQNTIAVSLFLLQLSFAYNPSFFLTWKKSYEDIILLHMLLLLQHSHKKFNVNLEFREWPERFWINSL